MKRQTTIQKIIASLLLLVFMIGASPKIYFHDLIADHKDVPTCIKNHTITAVHMRGYNCHFDNLVVTTPFISASSSIDCPAPLFFSALRTAYKNNFYSQHHFYSELRGPPAKI